MYYYSYESDEQLTTNNVSIAYEFRYVTKLCPIDIGLILMYLCAIALTIWWHIDLHLVLGK